MAMRLDLHLQLEDMEFLTALVEYVPPSQKLINGNETIIPSMLLPGALEKLRQSKALSPHELICLYNIVSCYLAIPSARLKDQAQRLQAEFLRVLRICYSGHFEMS